MDSYFIKSGYKPQNQSYTMDEFSGKEYWTPYRIRMAETFQYYVYRYAERLLRRHRYSEVLDVGSGPPLKIKKMISPHCDNVTLVDQPSIESIVNEILPSANFVAANLETIDIDLGTQFPIIICADVIEHLIDPNSCLRFIRKHLTDDGFAIISTPERDFLRGKDCMASPKQEHVREWNQNELAQYIKSHDFDIIEQICFPQQRQDPLSFGLSRFIPMSIWSHYSTLSKQWGSCQMIVCK